MQLDQQGNKIPSGVVTGVILEGTGVTLPAGRSTLAVDSGCSYLVTAMANSQFAANTVEMGGGAYAAFNGTDSYLTVLNDAALNVGVADCSISVRINRIGTSGIILSKRSFDEGIGYSLTLSATKLSCSFYNNGDIWVFSINQTNVPKNIWTHITVVKSLTQIKFYINGSLVTATQDVFLGSPNSDHTNPLTIGAVSGSSLLACYLDDIRIYKSAVTAPQALAIASSNGVYSSTQAGVASFVLNCNTDFDEDDKIYDQIGNLAATKTGGVTIDPYSPTDPSPIWSIGPSQTGLIKVPHGTSTLYYHSVGNVFVRKVA